MKQSKVKKLRELFLNEWDVLREAIEYEKQIAEKDENDTISFRELVHLRYGTARTITVRFEDESEEVSFDWRLGRNDGAYLIPINSPFLDQIYDNEPPYLVHPIEVCCSFSSLSGITGGFSFLIKKEATSNPYKYFSKDFADKLTSILKKN